MKRILLLIFLLIYYFDSYGQASKDSVSGPKKILVVKKMEIPVADSTDLSFIKVNWLIKLKFIKDEKFKDKPGYTNGILYIYIKKRYYKKAKRELGIK